MQSCAVTFFFGKACVLQALLESTKRIKYALYLINSHLENTPRKNLKDKKNK